MNNEGIELVRSCQADILIQILAKFVKEDLEKFAKIHPEKVAGHTIDGYELSIPKRIKSDIEAAKKEIKHSLIDNWTFEDVLKHFVKQYAEHVIHDPLEFRLHNFEILEKINRNEEKILFTISPKLFESRFENIERGVRLFVKMVNVNIIKDLKNAVPSLFPKKTDALERKIINILLESFPEKVAGKILEQEIRRTRKVDKKENIIRKIKYKINKSGWTIKKERYNDYYSIINVK